MKDGFHGHAEAKAGRRDAKLGGADVGINMRQDVARNFGAAMPFLGQRRQLRIANAHHGQFRHHEKRVEQHQQQERQYLAHD